VLFANWFDLCLVSTKLIVTRTFRKIGPCSPQVLIRASDVSLGSHLFSVVLSLCSGRGLVTDLVLLEYSLCVFPTVSINF